MLKTGVIAATYATLLILLPKTALAHVGHAEGVASLMDGFLHPISGVDHVLAMLAVGLVAAFTGGRSRWALPSAFLLAMSAGFVLSTGRIIALPAYEAMILASVIGLGLALVFALRLPVQAGCAIVALFGLAHGFAHGVEGASTASYLAGFLIATAMLHAAGLAFGALALRLERPEVQRLAGGAIVLAGAVLALA